MKNKPISLLLRENKQSFRSLSSGIFNKYGIRATAQHINNIARGRNEATPELEDSIRQYINNSEITKRNFLDDIHDLCLISEIILRKFNKSSVTKLILKTVLYKAVDIAEDIFSDINNAVWQYIDTQYLHTKISHNAIILLNQINSDSEALTALEKVIITNTISKKMMVSAIYENNIYSVNAIEDIVMCTARKIIIHPKEEEQLYLNRRELLDNWYFNISKGVNDSNICNTIESSYKKFYIELIPLDKKNELKKIWQHLDKGDIFKYTTNSTKNKKLLLKKLDNIKTAILQSNITK